MNMIAFPAMKVLGTALLVLLAQQRPEIRERWVYFPLDLSVEKNVAKLCDVMRRAAKAGYNAIVLEDANFAKLPRMPPAYFRSLERVKGAAAELKLSLVPGLFQIGHSQDLLAQDPNLAEGLPVDNALFVVRDGAACLEPDPPVAFRLRWDRKDDIVSTDWVTRNPMGRLARIVQKVKVHPFRQYHVSARVRTREFRGTPRIVVVGSGRMLNYDLPAVRPTQDWGEIHAVFNSLECEEVRVSLGCWDGETGELAWDAPKLEEVGLLNVLRRDGAPLGVKTEDGRALVEGRDFEKVVDPRLGSAPRPSGIEEWHEPPLLRTSLPDGTRLRVSYYHPLTFPDHGQVMICPSEPRTMELLREQALRLHEIFRPRAFLMAHDEIRVLNWDESCRRRHLDAGAIVAENARSCIRILREINPGGEIYVWSDMFDPHHNAHANYYLVRGDLTGAWEGLDRDVIIAPWFYDKRQESLQWFAGRGHRTLIAGYYDQQPERVRDWLEAGKKVEGVMGVMYTSWFDKYEDLEAFARFVDASR